MYKIYQPTCIRMNMDLLSISYVLTDNKIDEFN